VRLNSISPLRKVSCQYPLKSNAGNLQSRAFIGISPQTHYMLIVRALISQLLMACDGLATRERTMNTNPITGNDTLVRLLNLRGPEWDASANSQASLPRGVLENLAALGPNQPMADGAGRDLLVAEGFAYAAARALFEYFLNVITQTDSRRAGQPATLAGGLAGAATMNIEPVPAGAGPMEIAQVPITLPQPPPPAQPPVVSSTSAVELTARECDVLNRLAEGLSDAQIAAALVVSRRTVNSHLRSIYVKLGVCSRTAAIHAARQVGLL
jgi:DNA-binding CsgD family transcriptional regulator